MNPLTYAKIKSVAERFSWEYTEPDKNLVQLFKKLSDGSYYAYNIKFADISTYKMWTSGLTDGISDSFLLEFTLKLKTRFMPYVIAKRQTINLIESLLSDLAVINDYANKSRNELWRLILSEKDANDVESDPIKYIEDTISLGNDLIPSLKSKYAKELING